MFNPSFGDMTQQFQSTRQTAQVKSRLNTLANELTSGLVADVTAHLRGDTTQFAALNRDIALIDGYRQSASEVAFVFDQMQVTLGTVDTLRTTLSNQFLLVMPETPLKQIDAAAAAGRDGFRAIVGNLNQRFADRTLFAGTAVDGPALADAETMLADLAASLTSSNSAATIAADVAAWFDTPGGGFEMSGYLGATGSGVTRKLGDRDSVSSNLRADDQGLRDVMKSAALAALADLMAGTLSTETRAQMVADAGLGLASAGASLTATRGTLGEAQATTDAALTRLSASRTTLDMARNDLIAIDPFATATRLQDVQQQLEMLFTVTARISGLSLASFLR